MPSELTLNKKKEYVSQLREKVENSVAGVVVSYQGISVADDTSLRKELREAGIDYKVVKNTMLRFAVEGTAFADLSNVLEGSTALAVSNEDPIAAAKILAKYADKIESFELKAGYLDGKVLDAAGIAEIAKLPGKQELLSMLCSALSGNIRGLAVAINAIAEKQGDEAVSA
ncbi:50S ribosomal protein L10 [bacterium 210820-DFI.6.52]|uniref:Large ribosomal subunit protein uL10 n=1 Tax=Bittarella massiliensis (ex Durand et al. 2017) TaxID=1720313 RepID=A0AAQ1RW12_9FIRM|nr:MULTISPECIES: 50S ribosomal protein L10 [Eubacteriales]MCB5941539.1 50S ribosomal protein L10 [bacterium 210820-DFI.6.52]MCQ4948157.1 50S ribosomal protein L10 [Bittarella massiliensis (ex Durand et al. 2017)]MZL70247.1 50S ribosomal protein L10 [Bittarella massiliensis (ex Durand et al. 2017)]MZL80987.1 50S ribosomal protein L10 [Bittarella massiliensis (ex Durand et al. 2017)]SHG15813.1 LSU ribosomal protein L10P [Bittarella massiliensis (ex Durand et al. 2017)]